MIGTGLVRDGVFDGRRTPTHLVQRSRWRRLSGLAADEEERRRLLVAAQQMGQVVVRAVQERSLLLQRTKRTVLAS